MAQTKVPSQPSADDGIQASTPSPTIDPPKQWYHHLTLDLIVSILARSVFHPFIVFVFYLSIYATHRHKLHPRLPTYIIYHDVFLILCYFASWANHRLAYGPPRSNGRVRWEDEVAVVTGGASGLGRCLVQMLSLKGCKVGVLDLYQMDEEMKQSLSLGGVDERICWCVADITDMGAVEKAIERMVSTLGRPTILVNNAAAPIVPLPVLPLSVPSAHSASTTNSVSTTDQTRTETTALPNTLTTTIEVNLFSPYRLLQHTLPHLLSSPHGCTIITISSILPFLHPSFLSSYTLSKSALSSLHHTLTAEILSHPLRSIRSSTKTLLVETGHISTGLFAAAKTPWYADLIGPKLDPVQVARRIVEIVERGEGGVLRMPVYAWILAKGLEVLPAALKRGVRWVGGVDGAFAL